MEAQQGNSRHAQGLSRRDLLEAGLAAGIAVSPWPLYHPPALWGGEAESPMRRGVLRVRGCAPPTLRSPPHECELHAEHSERRLRQAGTA
jgi:hypothetical protein